MSADDYIDSPYGRSVKEWEGPTPDSDPPPKVRQRVFDRLKGRCHKCGRTINGAIEKWTCEHLLAIILGGENRERNLGLTCSICLPVKNKEDMAAKSLDAKRRKKHLNLMKPKRPFPKRHDPWGRERHRAPDVNDDLRGK
jgi:5-methylcytosine-specific restriction protein A